MNTEITEIKEMWKKWQGMSCKPDTVHLKPGTVIDEEKSVRWNREEVLRRNKEHVEELERLNAEYTKVRDELYAKIYEYIKENVGHNCNTEQAKAIWGFAYEFGHPHDFDEICNYLQYAIELASKLLSAN